MEETIYITFDEPLFFFFENEWINTLKLDIFLRINPSIPSSKKDPILSLISKKTSTIEKRFLIITHEYEFHYYSKSKFKKKEFLSNDLSDIAPNHIIQLSERYKDEIGEECELSNFFGCNGMSPNSKEKICLAMANLYHRARYSKSSLINQIQERMKMMVCLCLDELIKNIYNFVTEYSNEFKFSSIEIIEKLLNNEFRIDFDEQNEELRKVIENTVYKTIIANGLFPLYCEINTMNTFVLKQLFSSIFIPDSILPWSSRFHASFSIGSYYYSFNESNRVITKYFKNRALKEEFFYVRIRILDFFPLDDWVYLISDFFIKNLENILDEMVEMLNDANFGKELGESYIKNREEEGKKNSNPPENENTTKNINEPLLCPKIKKGFFKLLEKITEKNVNDKTNIREKFKCLEDMENFLDEFNFLKKRKEVIDICGKIAIEFFENYKFELVNSEILMNICKIIARTEIKQYELLSNNCQTPVAESLHIIHEKMKQFIEPLQELTIEKEEEREIFHKFSCSLDESLPNKSMVLDCNLDYFGIYTDKYHKKEFLYNLGYYYFIKNFIYLFIVKLGRGWV